MGEMIEGATNKGETKTAATGASKKNNGKKDEGYVAVVLKMEVHCDGCAKKVKRIVKQFKGVKDVNVDIAGKKLTVVGKVDPAKLRQGVEDKTHQKVELLSPLPSKDGGADQKPADKSEKKAEEKKSIAKESTVVLKINLHCDGCIKKIKSSISKIKGVDFIAIDASKDIVTIKGTMDAKDLAPTLQAKFRRSVDVVPPKKEEAAAPEAQKAKEGGGDKKAKEAAAGEKKQSPDKEEKKKEGGGEPPKVEVNKMEHHGFATLTPPPPVYWPYGGGNVYGGGYQNVEPYQLGYPNQYAPGPQYNNGYAMDPRVAHAPQMFSDENPNACSVM